LESQLPSLEKMLQDLRRVSLIARDAIEPRPQAIDAATLLRNATEQFRRRSGCGDGSLDVQIADELPRLEADPDLLEKSVLELLSNAARHSPSGGPIRLTADSEADEVVIRVSDHGSGIEPELLPYVFDLFVRSETGAVTAADRFGVGLTFVRQVVQKHGGEVGAESAGRGQGATFTIRLPTNPRT
jgi:signal transduction histidine kinase